MTLILAFFIWCALVLFVHLLLLVECSTKAHRQGMMPLRGPLTQPRLPVPIRPKSTARRKAAASSYERQNPNSGCLEITETIAVSGACPAKPLTPHRQ